MANTFTQIYVHIAFSVKGRQNLIQKSWKDELHKYICGIVNGKEQKYMPLEVWQIIFICLSA